MKTTKTLLTSLLISLSLGLIGCQGQMESTKISEPVTTGSIEEDKDLGLDVVNDETVLLEKSVNETLQEVEKVMADNGSLFGVSNITSALLGNVEESLKDVLTQLRGNLDISRTAVDGARGRILDQLALLDPNLASDQATIGKLQSMLDKIDLLDLKIDGALDKVKDKVGGFITKIEDKIVKLRKNPIANLLMTLLLQRFSGNVGGLLDILNTGV